MYMICTNGSCTLETHITIGSHITQKSNVLTKNKTCAKSKRILIKIEKYYSSHAHSNLWGMTSDLWPKREPFMLLVIIVNTGFLLENWTWTVYQVVFTTGKLWHNFNMWIGWTINFYYKCYCSSDLHFVHLSYNRLCIQQIHISLAIKDIYTIYINIYK